MSGHSKWSKIKHKKGAADASRGKLFAKLAKEIYVAAKNGDPDPDNNATLRLAIEKAKAQSMPKDNINRAIERAKGSQGGESFEEIVYEGYGANGVAVMCYCLTDNRNRTAAFVKSIFSRRGGNLGADGSVSYLFTRKGVIELEKMEAEEEVEEFMMMMLELDVEDIIDEEDGVIKVVTDPSNVFEIRDKIIDSGIVKEVYHADSVMLPSVYVELDEQSSEKVLALIEDLEENDDIQDVYHNLK